MSTGASVCTITPAYNEAESVQTVLTAIHRLVPQADRVVVNDGSSDATHEQAVAAGANVIDLTFNLGIGGAVQTGLKYAYRQGYDVALEIDADGQHDAASAPALLAALHEQGADMVIGSRFIRNTEYRSSVMRRFGIHLFSFLIKLVTGRRIYDSTSGFRAYSRRALKFLASRYPTDFPEPESIVMLLNAGFKIVEVPVEMKARVAGQSVVGRSDFSWRAGYFVVSNAIAILVSGLKPRQYD